MLLHLVNKPFHLFIISEKSYGVSWGIFLFPQVSSNLSVPSFCFPDASIFKPGSVTSLRYVNFLLRFVLSIKETRISKHGQLFMVTCDLFRELIETVTVKKVLYTKQNALSSGFFFSSYCCWLFWKRSIILIILFLLTPCWVHYVTAILFAKTTL